MSFFSAAICALIHFCCRFDSSSALFRISGSSMWDTHVKVFAHSQPSASSHKMKKAAQHDSSLQFIFVQFRNSDPSAKFECFFFFFFVILCASVQVIISHVGDQQVSYAQLLFIYSLFSSRVTERATVAYKTQSQTIQFKCFYTRLQIMSPGRPPKSDSQAACWDEKRKNKKRRRKQCQLITTNLFFLMQSKIISRQNKLIQ